MDTSKYMTKKQRLCNPSVAADVQKLMKVVPAKSYQNNGSVAVPRAQVIILIIIN